MMFRVCVCNVTELVYVVMQHVHLCYYRPKHNCSVTEFASVL